jgi:hypothetical protein
MKGTAVFAVLLSTGVLGVLGCNRSAPPAATADPQAPAAAQGLEGTVWSGTFSHANADGGSPTCFTWYFLARGKLRQVRDDGEEVFGTWKAEGTKVIVDTPYHGDIDLLRTGDTMAGVSRFRTGYGFGWEYELRLKK